MVGDFVMRNSFAGVARSGWGCGGVFRQGEKVIAKKNKVGILNPENKKRFTVVIGKDSKLTGFKGIDGLEKGDLVEGKYVVTDKGLYVVTKMSKN